MYSPAMSRMLTSPWGKTALRENGEAWETTVASPSSPRSARNCSTVDCWTWLMKSMIGVSS